MKGGSKGVQFNDRELAGKVRTLALDETFKVLKNPRHKLYGPLLTRLAGTILPRLNQISGEDGGAIIFQLSPTLAKKNGIDPTDTGAG
jgi:hypothetical protein